MTVITLGIYYPWAKAKKMNYYYSNTKIFDTYFQFHGIGTEIFLGLLKALGVFILLDFFYEGIIIGIFEKWTFYLIWILYFLIFFLIIIFASVGSRRYRMTRTSWRGIRFHFLGTVKETSIIILKGWILNLLSFGIYYPFYLNHFHSYWNSKTFFGKTNFSYFGNAREIFNIWIKGVILTIMTFGIYFFWLRANMHRYFWNHTRYRKIKIYSHLRGAPLMKETIIFLFISIITIGIGRAWAIVRYKKFFLETFSLEGEINLSEIMQSEEHLKGSAGEGMADLFDVEI